MRLSTIEVRLLRGQIQSLLSESNPRAVVKTISKHIATSSETELIFVKHVLSKLFDASKKELHCVRCHGTYTESGNAPYACEVEHEFDEEMDEVQRHREGWTTVMNCCGHEVENDGFPTGLCSVHAHTVDPCDVDYYDPRSKRGNKSVLTCAMNECPVKEGKEGEEDCDDDEDEEDEVGESDSEDEEGW